MSNRIVRRVRTLVYAGPESWVRNCTESPSNYVTPLVEFKDKEGNVTRSITSTLGLMEYEDEVVHD